MSNVLQLTDRRVPTTAEWETHDGRVEQLVRGFEALARKLAAESAMTLVMVDRVERAAHTVHVANLRRLDGIIMSGEEPR